MTRTCGRVAARRVACATPSCPPSLAHLRHRKYLHVSTLKTLVHSLVEIESTTNSCAVEAMTKKKSKRGRARTVTIEGLHHHLVQKKPRFNDGNTCRAGRSASLVDKDESIRDTAVAFGQLLASDEALQQRCEDRQAFSYEVSEWEKAEKARGIQRLGSPKTILKVLHLIAKGDPKLCVEIGCAL
eukprot:6205027-Pleurochrysis_carterae.AAC.1